MTTYLIRRFVNLIPTFIIATMLAWFIIDWAPGDFASQFAFDQVDPDKEQRIRAQLGLDQPAIGRYFRWLFNLVSFSPEVANWGISLVSKNDASALVIPRMWNSFALVLPATVLIYLIAIPIGVYSAIRKYSIGDRVLTIFSLLGLAIPNFFMALIVVALAVQFFQANGFFLIPVGGMTSPNYNDLDFFGKMVNRLWHLIGPLLVVTLSGLAGLTRVMRGQMLEVLSQDYIRTARAKGLADRVVNYKHALRNAILVIIATIGGVLPNLLLGAGTVEFVMGWPGITPLFIRSIFAQDVYVVMALLTIGVILLMIGFLISDIALALVDPRIRY